MIGTSETLERIRPTLAGLAFQEAAERDGMACLEVTPEILHDLLQGLRDRAGFESLTLVTGVDRMRPEAARMQEPRFEVIHQLRSLAHCERLRIRTRVPSDAAHVPTCTDLWPGAGFMERECYDMFGIEFSGHPDLRRLLMPEGYGHHPLRKDFPHQGIEPDRLYREWDAQRRKNWDPEQASEA